ncbi:MAG: HAMP domain-containing sensor histidine kinase [Lagierella massiliensis]|nr:HAMP domain-containing sensor histidine kinase [Lagierella massiliensis]
MIPVLLYVGIQLLVFSFIALILNYSSEELTIFFIIYSSFMFLIKIVQTIKKYGAHAFLIYDFFRGFKIKYTKVYFEAFVLIGLLVILYFYVIQENSDPIGLVLLGLLVYKVILSILKNYLGKVLLNRKIESLYNGEYEKVYIKDSTFNNSIVLMDNLYSAMKSSIDAEYKSEKLKTELITGVSHDLKTPLTSIINYVDLIKRAKTSEQRDKYINTLSYNAKRLKSMIIDLIEASKAGSGSIDLNMQVIELNELLLQTYGQFDKEFEENNLEFELDSFKDNIFIRLDADRLNRVFENLFSNIIKYARKDSVVKVDIKKEKSFLKISFRNKSSIEYEKDIRDLQKRFIRSTNAREIEGSGLGLYIVKASIELLGGEFQVRLEKDEFVAEIFFNTRVKK